MTRLEALPNLIRPQRIRLAASLVCLVLCAVLIRFKSQALYALLGSPPSTDFTRFWAAGHLLAEGKNIYNLDLISAYSEAHGAGTLAPLPFYYPFFSFSALLPLALLPYSAAQFLYLFALVFFYGAVWLARPVTELVRCLKDQRPVTRGLLKTLTLLTFLPFLILWWNGGLTVVPLAALLLFTYADEQQMRGREGRWSFIQGACVAIALVKPSVCFLVFSFLLAVWWRRRQWEQVIGFAAGLLLLGVPTALLFPEGQGLFHVPQAFQVLQWQNPTTSAFIQNSLGLPGYSRVVLAALAVLASLAHAVRLRSEESASREVCRLWIPLSLVAVPYAWTYDFVLLLLPVGLILQGRQIAISLLLLFNILLFVLPLNMELHWWYPLAVLLLCIREARAPVETRI